MKRMLSIFPFVAVAFALGFGGMALAKKKKSRYKAPYGMAGCGFGALVIDRNELLPQIGAWFLNGLYSNNSFAMTSGTSNCVPDKRLAYQEREVYLKSNWASLTKEAAQGEGEHLDGFADLLGCSTGVWTEFGKINKRYYSEIFAVQDTNQVLVQYQDKIKNNQLLSRSCDRI